MMTCATSVAEMALVRFAFFRPRNDGFGTLLVGAVLIALVAWIVLRSSRDAA
jgi:hypothetical protein